MPVRFSELVVDCRDAITVGRFWQEVLGWESLDADPGEVVLRGPGDAPVLLFTPVPEPKTVKDRIHIDVSPVAGSTQDEEVARILALGATPADVGQGDDVSWVVLADPEGNEFCVLRGR